MILNEEEEIEREREREREKEKKKKRKEKSVEGLKKRLKMIYKKKTCCDIHSSVYLSYFTIYICI
jgi:hypothetical protein